MAPRAQAHNLGEPGGGRGEWFTETAAADGRWGGGVREGHGRSLKPRGGARSPLGL